MKLAILFPGFLDSPNYRHMEIFSKRLNSLGYETEVLDPCGLWVNNDTDNYTVTNYLKDIKTTIDSYKDRSPNEIILIGHSLGGFVAILAGDLYHEVTRVISLCSPASIEGLGSKWKNKPFKRSQRDLPNDSSKYRDLALIRRRR